jgi:hypothetical protein
MSTDFHSCCGSMLRSNNGGSARRRKDFRSVDDDHHHLPQAICDYIEIEEGETMKTC